MLITILKNCTQNLTSDPFPANESTQFLVIKGLHIGVRLEFEAAFVPNPTETDWIGVPDLSPNSENPIWPVCINQMPFMAPFMRVRVCGTGPDSDFDLFITDGQP